MNSKVQSVTGFKVVNYVVRRVKDVEKLKIVIEAEVEDMLAGETDMGTVQKALLNHLTSDTDVGFSVLVE